MLGITLRWWKKLARPEADLLTFLLERGIRAGQCAICSLLVERERQSLWILLRESVLDVGTRQVHNQTLGFCPKHTAGLCAVGASSGTLPGVAILFGSTAREAARRLRAGRPLGTWHDCIECQREASSEASHVRQLARHLSNARWRDQWSSSLQLCVEHTATLSRHGPAVFDLARRHLLQVPSRQNGPGNGEAARKGLAALQAALLGSQLSEGAPAHPRWGCRYCEAEATAAIDEARRLLQAGNALPGCLCRRHAILLLKAGVVDETGLLDHYTSAMEKACVALQDRQVSTGRRDHGKEVAARQTCPLCAPAEHASGPAPADIPGNGAPSSETPLCLRHTELVLESRLVAKSDAPAFRGRQAQQLEALAQELDEMHRKSAWDARHEPKGEEQTSWIRATHCFGYDS